MKTKPIVYILEKKQTNKARGAGWEHSTLGQRRNKESAKYIITKYFPDFKHIHSHTDWFFSLASSSLLVCSAHRTSCQRENPPERSQCPAQRWCSLVPSERWCSPPPTPFPRPLQLTETGGCSRASRPFRPPHVPRRHTLPRSPAPRPIKSCPWASRNLWSSYLPLRHTT